MKRNLGLIAAILALTLSFTAERAIAQWVRTKWPVGCCYQDLRPAVIGNSLFVGSWVSNGQQSSGLGGIDRTTDFGDSWTQVNDSLTGPFAVVGTNLFARQGYSIFISTNKGGTWTEAKDSGLPPLSYIESFVTIGTTLYSLGHSIYRSTDYGASWSFVGPSDERTSGYISSFCVLGSKYFAIYQSGYSGQAAALYTSADSGLRWIADSSNTLETYLGDIAVSGSSILMDGWGGMVRSIDSGSSWTEVAAGPLGVLTVTDSALLATSYADGVYLSINSGTSWRTFNEGLPEPRLLSGFSLAVCGPYLFLVNDSLGIFRRPLSQMFATNEVKQSTSIQIDLSPNPTTGLITIQGTSANLQHLTLTNLLGQSLIELANPRAGDITLDLSKLPAGIYFARFEVEGGGEVVMRKIVKE